MEKPVVSIIIPVFMGEEYIEHCICSVINQTYQNLEIILVDDGSPDRCPQICDLYAQKDSRIKVIHKKNGGVADARNIGVASAYGKYIAFVDCDDMVAENHVEIMLNAMQYEKADVVCAKLKVVDNHNAFLYGEKNQSNTSVMTGIQAIKVMLSGVPGKELQFSSVCGKLFPNELVKQFLFPSGRRFEDTSTTYKMLYSATRVVVLDSSTYLYYKNEKGIIASSNRKKDEDRINAYICRAEWLEEQGESNLAIMAYQFALRYLYADSILNNGRCDKELKALIKKIGGFSSRNVYFHYKLYLIAPRVFRFFRKSFRKMNRSWQTCF